MDPELDYSEMDWSLTKTDNVLPTVAAATEPAPTQGNNAPYISWTDWTSSAQAQPLGQQAAPRNPLVQRFLGAQQPRSTHTQPPQSTLQPFSSSLLVRTGQRPPWRTPGVSAFAPQQNTLNGFPTNAPGQHNPLSQPFNPQQFASGGRGYRSLWNTSREPFTNVPSQNNSPKRDFEEFGNDDTYTPEDASDRYMMSGALPAPEQEQEEPYSHASDTHPSQPPSTFFNIMTTVGTYFLYATTLGYAFTRLIPERLRRRFFQPIHIVASPADGVKRRAISIPGAYPVTPHGPKQTPRSSYRSSSYKSPTPRASNLMAPKISPAHVSSIRVRFSRYPEDKPSQLVAPTSISAKPNVETVASTTKPKRADIDTLLQMTRPQPETAVVEVHSVHTNMQDLRETGDGTLGAATDRAPPRSAYDEESPQSSSDESTQDSIKSTPEQDEDTHKSSDQRADAVEMGIENMTIAPKADDQGTESPASKPEEVILPPSPTTGVHTSAKENSNQAIEPSASPMYSTRDYGRLPARVNLREGYKPMTLDEIFSDEHDKIRLYCTEDELPEALAVMELSEARKAKQAVIKAKQAAEETRKREAEELAARKAEEEAARKAAEEAAAAEAAKKATEAALKAKRAANLIRRLGRIEVNEVQEALKSNPSRQLRTNMTVRDLHTLVPNVQWLNDEVVNTYLGDLVLRAQQKLGYTADDKKSGKAPPFHNHASFWYTKIKNSGAKGVLSWDNRARLNNGRLLQCEALFIPVCENYHWRLIVISGTKRRIEYFDSLHGRADQYIDAAHEYVKATLGPHYKAEEWTIIKDHNSPRQQNGSDCGVFACMTALSTVQGLDIHRTLYDATERNMMVARYQMAATIIVNAEGGGFTRPTLDWV